MSEGHVWLTEEEVERLNERHRRNLDANIGNQRLIADRHEMRKLAEMLARGWWIPDYPYEDENYVYEPQCRYCLVTGIDQSNVDNPEIDHKDWCPYQAYLDMLGATK